MSSDIYTGLEVSFHTHNMLCPDTNGDLIFLSDPDPYPYPFPASPKGNSLQPLTPSFFSFSPSPSPHAHFGNCSALHDTNSSAAVDYAYNHHSLSQTASKFMQRSFSCNTFQPHPNTPTTFQCHSPQNIFFTRRVCSTGDLQNYMKATDMSQTESPLLEEANLKVGRYSAEERQQKISKYRAKRSQRKFKKIIKYACRKTLADNRIRIRGRFARNDENSDIPKVPSSTSTTQEYEDDFWVQFIEGLNDQVMD
ncbi:hypothetical protein Fmac_002026 [Flemingia macrophylla]|uniref:CCT domain-containing protein n=1 Tax=Flemingia macrophylla TaxID=520843 RepID=A0ABD1NIR9_9FABA